MLLTALILFIVSFDTLEPLEYGLVYDNTYKKVSRDTVHESGRYLVGLGRRFIRFPRSLVEVSWVDPGGNAGSALGCWSVNGQNVYLDISMQVRLVKENIPTLYYMWGEHAWLDALRVTTKRTLKDTAARYETLDFFTERTVIADDFRREIERVVGAENVFKLVHFQLRQVDLPDTFEEAILKKILQIQQRRTAEFQMQVTRIQEEVAQQMMEAEADARVTLDNATALGTLTIAIARANTTKALISSIGKKYSEIGQSLGWTTADQMFSYIWARMPQETKSSSTKQLVGFDQALVNI